MFSRHKETRCAKDIEANVCQKFGHEFARYMMPIAKTFSFRYLNHLIDQVRMNKWHATDYIQNVDIDMLWRSTLWLDEARQQAASCACADGCQEKVSTTPLPCYGVESTPLNPGMNTDPPLHTPYERFDYGTNDDDGNDGRCKLNNEMCNAHLNQSPITTTLCPGIDNSTSPAVVNAFMECIQAKDRHALMVLEHDVEHHCAVELLKILEDAQSPD